MSRFRLKLTALGTTSDFNKTLVLTTHKLVKTLHRIGPWSNKSVGVAFAFSYNLFSKISDERDKEISLELGLEEYLRKNQRPAQLEMGLGLFSHNSSFFCWAWQNEHSRQRIQICGQYYKTLSTEIPRKLDFLHNDGKLVQKVIKSKKLPFFYQVKPQ